MTHSRKACFGSSLVYFLFALMVLGAGAAGATTIGDVPSLPGVGIHSGDPTDGLHFDGSIGFGSGVGGATLPLTSCVEENLYPGDSQRFNLLRYSRRTVILAFPVVIPVAYSLEYFAPRALDVIPAVEGRR